MPSLRSVLGQRFPRTYFHLGFPGPGMAPHLELGQLGESHVARCLRQAGWDLLAQKALVPAGEVDLVALQKDTLVLVEVKSALCPMGQARWRPETSRWRPGHRFGHDQFEVYRRALSQVAARLPGKSPTRSRIDLVEVLWRHARANPLLIHHVDLRSPLPRPIQAHRGEKLGLPP